MKFKIIELVLLYARRKYNELHEIPFKAVEAIGLDCFEETGEIQNGERLMLGDDIQAFLIGRKSLESLMREIRDMYKGLQKEEVENETMKKWS